MKTKWLFLALALTMFGFWWLAGQFAAPSVNDVDVACTKLNLAPGQTVHLGDRSYLCPEPKPTPIPVDNLAHRQLEVAKNLCQTNDPAWTNPTNDRWLAMNVIGPATSWQYQEGQWVYTYVPEHITLTFGGYTKKYVDGFSYPGFGTFIVHLYEGGTTTVSADTPPQRLKYIKLELSCPM